MLFLNLTALQLAISIATISAAFVLIYASKQRRQHVAVSTLRFWAAEASGRARRRFARIQQPWSLLLILLAAALLLFAIARPQWGPDRGRFHILLVDTSSASSFHAGHTTALETEKQLARRYLKRLSTDSQVLVVAADSGAFPLCSFTDPRDAADCLKGLHSTTRAWDADQSFRLAASLRALHPEQQGEIVYIGPARASRSPEHVPSDVRVLKVNAAGPAVAITSLRAEPRSTTRPMSKDWLVRTTLRNYSAAQQLVQLHGSAGEREVTLQPFGATTIEQDTESGQYSLQLGVSRAVLNLPAAHVIHAIAWTNRPDLLRYALAGVSNLDLQTRPPGSFDPASSADFVVLDGFTPKKLPRSASLEIGGGDHGRKQKVVQWTQAGAFSGMHDQDFSVDGVRTLPAAANDTVIARTSSGPVALAHTDSGGRRRILLGFDPLRGEGRYSLTTPLLLARAAEWLANATPQQPVFATVPTIASNAWVPPANVTTGLPASHIGDHTNLWALLTALACTVLALEWGLFARTKSYLRFAVMAIIVFALFVPSTFVVLRHRTAITVLTDHSGSVGRGWQTVTEKKVTADWVSMLPFGTPNRTDIEAALAKAVAQGPHGYAQRILLESDGSETHGSALRAAAHLKALRILVDTALLQASKEQPVTIVSVSGPASGYSGWPIALDVAVDSHEDADSTVALSIDGRLLSQQPIHLRPGMQHLALTTRVDGEGVFLLNVRLHMQGGSASSDRVMRFVHPKALIVGGDAQPDLVRVLQSAGFRVNESQTQTADAFSASQLVVLNNVNSDQLSAAQKNELVRYVGNGGGLLVLGGEKAMYHQPDKPDPLEAVMPAKLAPPEAPTGIAVVLVIDKSSSMEGRKIELARLSASAVVDRLKSDDVVGVLMFDNSYEWVVPLRKAVNKANLKRLIDSIAADGGTQIAPALAEAYRRILRTQATTKHIILLTDGISEEGESIEMSRDALLHGVTISTVGLGMDVNKTYLENVANTSGGMSYFLHSPDSLKDVVLEDIKDFSGKTVVEQEFKPVVLRTSEVLADTGVEHAPPLRGYARYQAKPDAETLLTIGDRHDPLYVQWQYGLGRAAVFASDATNRWASHWVTWKGFDRFWENAARHLAAAPAPQSVHARFDHATGEIVVTSETDAPSGNWFVYDPSGRVAKLQFQVTPDGLPDARVPAQEAGMYRVIEANGEAAEAGAYVPANDQGMDNGADLLKQIARETGGVFNPESEDARRDVRAVPERVPLWPLWLALALLVLIADVLAARFVKTASISS